MTRGVTSLAPTVLEAMEWLGHPQKFCRAPNECEGGKRGGAQRAGHRASGTREDSENISPKLPKQRNNHYTKSIIRGL